MMQKIMNPPKTPNKDIDVHISGTPHTVGSVQVQSPSINSPVYNFGLKNRLAQSKLISDNILS